MNQERLMNILRAPIVSEKSTNVAEQHNQAVFEVATDATKIEIKKAVELLFKVEVNSVRTVVVKGERKRFGRVEGRRKDTKKAYVQLGEGQEIDFVGLS